MPVIRPSSWRIAQWQFAWRQEQARLDLLSTNMKWSATAQQKLNSFTAERSRNEGKAT